MLRKIILRKITNRTFGLCILSAGLLSLSFAPTDFWLLAWIALVPWFLALDGKKPLKAFGLGYLVGIIFFWLTLYWFIHVTMLGAVILTFYLALYFGLFALGYCAFSQKSPLVKLFLLASWWAVLEYLRGHLLTGFGWVALGHSQYKNLFLIQIADVTGVYGISFLVVMGNVFFKEIIARFKLRPARALSFDREMKISLAAFVCLTAAALGYGFYRVHQKESCPSVTIAVIQANTPQENKWDAGYWPSIMKQYLALTAQAAAEKPDLIIWPESAYPGYVWETPELFESLKEYVRTMQIPLLLGIVTYTGEEYHNSAALISKDGQVIQQYDKLHLVPFGEYIPLRRFLPFMSTIVPIEDFTVGMEYTVFPIELNGKRTNKFLSVLICFEDTVPELARGFVNNGANLLVNVTNDAWFKDTKAPFLHLAAAILRSVENRRGLVRAANTGVSCFIDSRGRILRRVEDTKHKPTYVSGFAIQTVDLNATPAFYTKYGDIFTYFCLGGILMGAIKMLKVRKRRKL